MCAERPVWKNLMPSIVERCRNGWRHKETCEYRKVGRIPLSTAPRATPICSCGKGKMMEGFPRDKRFKRLAQHATRIALHPVFSVPYETRLDVSSMGDVTSNTNGFHIQEAPGRPHGLASSSVWTCGHCGLRREGLKACSKCGRARYCDRECQRAAWKEHKKFCGK